MAENNIEKNNIGFPKNQGLYDSSKEHDSCGVGFIVDTKNNASHDIVSKGLSMLCNLEHRGAVGADPKAGDGSGILIQIPHEFFEKEINHFELPQKNEYAVGVFFLRKDEELKNAQIDLATRDAELKAAVDARKDLDKQLDDKKKRCLIFIRKLMILSLEWVNTNQYQKKH